MQKVLRSCVLGLLLVTGMSVSAVKKIELNTLAGWSLLIWGAQEVVCGAYRYTPSIISGGKEILENGYNNQVKPVVKFFHNNGTTTVASIIAVLSAGGFLNEFFFKNKDTSSGYTAAMYSGSFFTSIYTLLGKTNIWQSAVGSKDKLIKTKK